MKNALTVDVEEWYHVCGVGQLPEGRDPEHRVRRNTEALLELLDEFGVTATFFVLGSVACHDPGLVARIASSGHEIASHGYSHRLVPEIGRDRFRDEIRRTGELLERQSGRHPVGFRAPQWSLGSKTPWAFEILREEGYRYDSSLNPLPFVGDRRGLRTPYLVAGGLLEFPPLVTPLPGLNLPTGGGWGFRFFPRQFVTAGIRGLNNQGCPAVLYIHPREMDPHGPRLQLPRLREFVVYGPRRSVAQRLRPLLASLKFTTLEHLADLWDSASSYRPTTPLRPSLP